jgi:DUF4097 and DUF4098 domain-containing protein YvlB
MRKIILMMLMLLLLVIQGFSGENIQKEFKVQKEKLLKVNLKNGGSISVTGWNKEKVMVYVEFGRSNSDDWETEFEESPEGIEIESYLKAKWKNQKSSPKFTINVPLKFDLSLKTMGGGITISNVDGDISGKTMGGSLDLTQLKGTIDLKTMGGKIILSDSDIDGKVKTMGGRVLLENVIGDVSGSSMGGNVIYKNVKKRNGQPSGKAVRISTMGGDINVSEAAEGADVHTMGGDIKIKSAGKFVQAKTMGGDITVDAIDGRIKATTMGGAIDVTMVGDPQKGDRDVTLSSYGGNISLKVPKGLSMDVDIELAITKKAKKKYEIISDFKLKQKTTDEWEYHKGSARKYIYATGKLAGGKFKIKIKTVNGNIYLKKLD